MSYFILTKFEPNMRDPHLREGNYEADVVFRGGKFGNMAVQGWLEDFQLVAKEDEPLYLAKTLPDGQRWRPPTEVPRFVDLPPMLKEILKQEAIKKRVKFDESELKLPYIVKLNDPFSLVKYKDN